MRKTFMGVRLRRLREERGLTQVALADALELSASYLSQLEKNQRPLTVPVLLRLNAVFGVDVQLFSEGEEARLIADLRDALPDAGSGEAVSMAETRELAANMPAVGRALLSLHRRYRAAVDRAEAMAMRLGDDWQATAPPPMPYEEVRDFFYARHNHIAELDDAAEHLHAAAGLAAGVVNTGLADYLARRHGVRVAINAGDAAGEGVQRRYDPASRVLHLSAHLRPGQQAFQMATQLAFLEMGAALHRIADEAAFSGDEAQTLARIGLANYFAGALILPYGAFLRAAEALRYDIERLGRQFGVGFETICHRLSTLQRAGARGVPFFFVRVDRAGNMSKRQSATDFHFSRVGGTCPLWNVYEAFTQPGRVLTQLARMPDGRTYLWIARTVARGHGGYGAPGKTFAIGLGCDVRHAARLVYAKGLDLNDPEAATPIGVGCKVCERPACPQRAFPPIGRTLAIDAHRSRFAPYPVA
ncbi:ImmA/IrrE family metallo-endopeptidase [Vineibacter terrae]|uniref:ImmA/IrrE family metallo-endopeptidase n=1 Tax=Vineibacter terrae TaxID=2586908 RepID=A0A5C8PVE1_9HYPH|nr:short-chain fatty acyl-CoA regulator family protein [Vineibacter terrae]TXL81943.1 ImmA/IrrE family metallo-endopeptidase [Vineibacter terrae]